MATLTSYILVESRHTVGKMIITYRTLIERLAE